MRTEIVLIGPHGSGKSTLGARLALALDVPFHDEIGRRLASNPAIRASAISAADAQPEFDRRVAEEELARDRSWSIGRGRVIESWHPGNLGFAGLRSPQVASEFLPAIRESIADRDVIVIPLFCSVTTLGARRTETAPIAFFVDVAARATAWARELGLLLAPPIATDSGGLEAALASALRTLASQGVTP